MKSITQYHDYGCGVACTAYILKENYHKTLKLFVSGEKKARTQGFFLRDIILALAKKRLDYEGKYITTKLKKAIYKENTIVFIKRSKRYPAGHYLCRTKDRKWMDPWINFPSDLKSAQSGFRKKLPGKPIYSVGHK